MQRCLCTKRTKRSCGGSVSSYKWRDEASGETHRSSKYIVGEAGGAPEVPVKRLFF